MSKNKNILCVCTMGRNRSKYLAEYLEKKGYNTKYGGVGPCRWDPEPENPIKLEDLVWADLIIAVQKKHKIVLLNDYHVKENKILNLEVSDNQELRSQHPEDYSKLPRDEFNKKWTNPQLEKKKKKYIPL